MLCRNRFERSGRFAVARQRGDVTGQPLGPSINVLVLAEQGPKRGFQYLYPRLQLGDPGGGRGPRELGRLAPGGDLLARLSVARESLLGDANHLGGRARTIALG